MRNPFSRKGSKGPDDGEVAIPPEAQAKLGQLTPFNMRLYTAKQDDNYMPVWEAFVNTKFFVPVHPAEGQSETISDFRFAVHELGPGNPGVTIAEDLELLRLNNLPDTAIQMGGAKLVQSLHPKIMVAIALPNNDVFMMPADHLQWLRDSMQLPE